MFRKITHIIISILLILSTTGISISEHYCGDEIMNISLNSVEKPCCEIPSDCCHNEIKHIQMRADFTKPPGTIQFYISEFHLFEFPALLLFGSEIITPNSVINTDEFYIPDKHIVLLKNQSFLF